MDYEAIIFGLLMLLFFGSDLLVMALSIRGLKDSKAKASWSSMVSPPPNQMTPLTSAHCCFGIHSHHGSHPNWNRSSC